MANLLSSCQGFRKSGKARNEEATRLGDSSVVVRAQTWQTFVRVYMSKNGSGILTLTRKGEEPRVFSWEEETEE